MSGMCSAECLWGCPDGSECVDLGEGAGRCAPLAAERDCDVLPGFEDTVLHTAKGKFVSVCAPLALETSCTVAGVGGGECIDVDITDCSGTVHSGACPGGNSIKCCTP
ncbi:MAG: hypothetical protein KJO07_24435, partial [Deltaproteobacteria bacterium]|nr:hypothetical protein [Deltaproteobacteria bacterium]